MAIDSVDTLLAVLRRTQIFGPEQADQVEQELAPHYADPLELADYLVQIEWLTGYQHEMLFAGEWDQLAIGPYILLDRLGEGGVSEVFKAWDAERGRVVAVKVLRHNLASQSDAVRQFQRELAAVPRLNHPNVIRTFDAHQLGTLHYFAMEYVVGMDLDKFVQSVGPLPVEQACDYVRQVAQGLQHAHQFGLVHRDIKPANLFLINPPAPGLASHGPMRRGPESMVKILDWGLARIQLPQGVPYEADDSELESEKGVLIGTADYVSPEQARDATIVDTRGDIYSLGCTFVFLLTGRPPFQGKTLMQKLMQHQQSPPPSVRKDRPDVPEELDLLIQKMMAKDPRERFQIPLLVVAPLRKFCSTAVAGMLIRSTNAGQSLPARPSMGNGVSKPGSTPSISINGRPGSNPNVTPGSNDNADHKPGSNGTSRHR
jgi:serine/threonine-protein kinase